jgi:hypothetical protein
MFVSGSLDYRLAAEAASESAAAADSLDEKARPHRSNGSV